MKKLLAILLALVMVLSMAACGGDSGTTAADDGKGEGNAATDATGEGSGSGEGEGAGEGANDDLSEKMTFKIGLPTNAKILSFEDNELTKWIEEQCNVELVFQEYAGGTDVATQISTAIAARQELPDILYGVSLNNNAISSYGNEGYFVDLTPYYNDKEGASKVFWDRMDQCLAQDQQDTILRTITDGDSGKIFSVPTVETSTIDKRKYQPWINVTWLDELGLDMPTNTDELYAVLKEFQAKKPGGDSTIPLFGSEKSGGSAGVADWIINMFLYYHPDHRWQDYDNDGTLQFVYTRNEYREALKFLNKLYKEGLLSNMVYTASSSDMKAITTPASGEAMCGIFCGHLTIHTTPNNMVLEEYEPMPLWGYAVEGDLSCSQRTFITDSCAPEKRDRAFKILMTLWSEPGSMRVRYGAYGANWTDPDEGAVSDMGYAAQYKLLRDPLNEPNTAHWGTIASCFNFFAEGETAQMDPDMSPWLTLKSELHAWSRAIFDDAAKNNNPAYTCPTLVYTTEEKEKIDMITTNISSLVSKKEMAYITGIDADINSDADWEAFQAEMIELGLEDYAFVVRTAYAREFE